MTKIRQYFYLASGAIAGILPVLTFFKLVSTEQALNLSALVDNFGSLIGAAAAGTAGVILAKQRKDGTVDAPVATPVEVAIQAIPQVVESAAKAQADLERLKTAAAEAIGNVPVYGDDAKAIINSLPNF
ncbi:holin [Mycobacterium phage SheaKeira]|nr:holin [Mycobacterium phage SheaKeira]